MQDFERPLDCAAVAVALQPVLDETTAQREIPIVLSDNGTAKEQARQMPLRIALTFDDGPHPKYTVKLIELLAERIIPATFFVLGSNAKRSPHLLNLMHQAGHEIGNHGWSHTSFASLNDAEIVSELNQTHELIYEKSSQRCQIYRPPYGVITTDQESFITARLNYRLSLWNVDSLDWQKPTFERFLETTTGFRFSTAILLFHDFSPITCQAFPRMLDHLIAADCTFYTASRILDHL